MKERRERRPARRSVERPDAGGAALDFSDAAGRDVRAGGGTEAAREVEALRVQAASGDAGAGATAPADGAEESRATAAVDFAGIERLVRPGHIIFPDEPLPHFGISKPLGKARFRYEDLSEKDQAVIRALVLALKSQGYGYREIRRMVPGLPMTVILRILRAAREAGDLKDVLADMDYEIVPAAVDNYRRAVMRGDLEISGEVLHGRGILVTHQKTASTSVNAHQLEVIWKGAPAPGAAPIDVTSLPGQIAASPRTE